MGEMDEDSIAFTQNPTLGGETIYFTTRNDSYAVFVNSIPGTVTLEEALRVMRRYGALEHHGILGTDDDLSWSLKVTYFTHHQAQQARASVVADSRWGGTMHVKRQKPVSSATISSRARVFGLVKCTNLLNGVLTPLNWSSTVAITGCGMSSSSSGKSGSNSSGGAPYAAGGGTSAAAVAPSSSTHDGATAESLGLLLPSRATFFLPPDAFDRPSAARAPVPPPGSHEYDDDDVAMANHANDATGDGVSSEDAGWGPGAQLHHVAFTISRGFPPVQKPRTMTGLKQMKQVKPVIKRPALGSKAAVGPCVHATCTIFVHNPDGTTTSSVGCGGCGCKDSSAAAGFDDEQSHFAPPQLDLGVDYAVPSGMSHDEIQRRFDKAVEEGASRERRDQLHSDSLAHILRLSARNRGARGLAAQRSTSTGPPLRSSDGPRRPRSMRVWGLDRGVMRRRSVDSGVITTPVDPTDSLFTAWWNQRKYDAEGVMNGHVHHAASADAFRNAAARLKLFLPLQMASDRI